MKNRTSFFQDSRETDDASICISEADARKMTDDFSDRIFERLRPRLEQILKDRGIFGERADEILNRRRLLARDEFAKMVDEKIVTKYEEELSSTLPSMDR